MRTSVTWWNLENLFDTEDSAERPGWLQRQLRSELKGWTGAVLDQKVGRLVEVIGQLNGGAGPDVLGVCEVENRAVLDRLVAALGALGRPYAVAHADTGDGRGIDVAVLYDADRFETRPGETFSHHVLKRAATRDIFQVNLYAPDGRLLIVVGNHWPSRLGGVYETEPYRIIAAETLAYWMERITEIKGRHAAVLVLGDFNDEPFSRSMTDYALGTASRARVLNARTPRLLNLSWAAMGRGEGTHYHGNVAGVLDQVLVSRGLVTGRSGFRLAEPPAEAVRLDVFPGMARTGDYPGPRRFGRPSRRSSFDPTGYSDHFPISVDLEDD